MIAQYIVLSGPWEDLKEQAEQSLLEGRWTKWLGNTPQEALDRCNWQLSPIPMYDLHLWLCINHKLAWKIQAPELQRSNGWLDLIN